MKKLLLLYVFLTFLHLSAAAQRKGSEGSARLLLTRAKASGTVELMVNPNKEIKLFTANGQKFKLPEFTLLGDTAIASAKDTVMLKEIVFLKASVKGDYARKAGGGILNLAGALPAAGIAIGGMMNMMLGGSPKLLLYTLPGIGVASIGAALTGARRFDTTQKWNLRISSGNENMNHSL